MMKEEEEDDIRPVERLRRQTSSTPEKIQLVLMGGSHCVL